jgi:dTDP-4-amino-4,6-dideoxy-D-galactose acyltransferase
MDKLKFLEWDSAFFGKKIYRYNLTDVKRFNEYEQVVAGSDAELVYLFSSEPIVGSSDKNFFIADKKIIFSKSLDSVVSSSRENIYEIHQSSSELQNLALLSGIHSRFKLDERLSFRFQDMYLQWLTRSLRGEMASRVFVYRIENMEVGFITVKKEGQTGIIGLIATDPAYQGKNIGSSLIAEVSRWCLCNQINRIEVATQLDNEVACSFYAKNGFVTKHVDYIYHHYIL